MSPHALHHIMSNQALISPYFLFFSKEHYSPSCHQCVNDKLLTDEEVKSMKSTGILHHCSLEDCRGNEVVAVVCHFCRNNFCFRHRHPPDHNCEKIPKEDPHMPLTTALVNQIIAKNNASSAGTSEAQRTKKKFNPTAQWVKLMKLKMNAIGEKEIPESERVLLEAVFPSGVSKPFFVSKQWSLGRCLDQFTATDNTLSASATYSLFAEDEDKPVAALSSSVKRLIEEEIIHEADTLYIREATAEQLSEAMEIVAKEVGLGEGIVAEEKVEEKPEIPEAKEVKLCKKELSKKEMTALKVQIMKIKMKAIGDKSIPQADKLHFVLRLPSGEEKPVFVSKNWSIGRCFDSLCQYGGIHNTNNIEGGKRLNLFTEEQCEVPLDMSASISSLIEGQFLFEGQQIFIK